MSDERGTVYIVDDDPAVRSLLRRLVGSIGLSAETFATADEFFSTPRAAGPSCLVLDVRLPGHSGLDLQERLSRSGAEIPIIFITGFGSVPQSVRAMKGGAVDFLEKPFDNQTLLDAVTRALDRSAGEAARRVEMEEIAAREATLTFREKQVLALIVAGLPNKAVAAELFLSEKTVKIHRANVMRKMRAASFAELVRMTERLGIAASR